MWIGTVLVATCLLTVAAGQRPRSCPAGTTYKIDCNTCTCAADATKDKCSQINCNRPTPTPFPPGKPRPGICPTIVPEPPGSDICKKRTEKSSCTEDKDCILAKKCCSNGCNIMSCRVAIYNYN